MTGDDGLVRELAELMHRADHGDLPTGDGVDDGHDLLRIDLDTFEAAHAASQWEDEEPPRVRRRRTG